MALERFRSGGARGIARFLSDHQHCDSGFEVSREAGAGTGRLSITCKGCGHGITYKAAEAGELAAGPQLSNGGNAHAPELPSLAPSPRPPAGPRTPAPGPVSPPAPGPVGTEPVRGGRGRLPRWLVPALIGLVIAAGVVMIAIGLTRSGGEAASPEGGTPTAPAEATAPAETAPPAETEPEPPPPAETAAPAPAPAPSPSAQGARLKRREVDGRYAIGVPVGWDGESDDGVLSITPPGGVAAIRIFYEPGAESDMELAEGARGFLADEHDGAQVGRPQRIRVGSIRGLEVTATYGGGTETAMVLTRGGYSFLVLRRVDRGASEAVAGEASASFASFRAKR
jgi:hypothetical protein